MKYNTLKSTSTSLFKEKGSKFIGYAFPLDSKDDVKKHLDQIREEHPKARHICSALLIGSGADEYYLTNDDGEPSNSAGAPILGQIRSHDLTNVYIAVVRYFGGTKLGISGLIKAYKESAALAIQANEIVSKEPQAQLKVKVPFAQMGLALSIVDKNQLSIKQHTTATAAYLEVTFKASEKEQILQLFDRFEVEDN
jgi:uncharacterized YigZ family protein